MTSWVRTGIRAAAVIAVSLWGAASVSGAPLIVNGGFEAGFAGWTSADQLGSDGTWSIQTGTSSPVNGDAVPTPPGGLAAAMTDAQGPGSHLLYQDLVVPTSVGSATLSYSLFIGNRADNFYNPVTPSLDFATPALNQQARVDIMLAGADPFSVAATDVLLNVYQTNPGDPLVSGYTALTADLTGLFAAHLGQTLRLRFAETDNVFTFQLGVDDVAVEVVPVPEPMLLLLLTTGMAAYGVRRRR